MVVQEPSEALYQHLFQKFEFSSVLGNDAFALNGMDLTEFLPHGVEAAAHGLQILLWQLLEFLYQRCLVMSRARSFKHSFDFIIPSEP
jgi:hypothetical protein